MIPEHAALVELLLMTDAIGDPRCKHAATAITELSERLEQTEKLLEDICEESTRRLKRASDLIDTFRNPYDGGEFEHGEVPALDRARAALDKTEFKP